MIFCIYFIAFTFCCGAVAASRVGPEHHSNQDTSLRFLFQNNLNASDYENHVGAILLDPTTYQEAAGACRQIGETLITHQTILEHENDFLNLFSYLQYDAAKHSLPLVMGYFIHGGIIQSHSYMHAGTIHYSTDWRAGTRLPVLCTETSAAGVDSTSPSDEQKHLRVGINDGNTVIGFRDQKSFRFLGIPFADPPKRFRYAKQYSGVGQKIQALSFGSRCAQPYGGGTEDCLFLNIYTPYIPKEGTRGHLKPVMFWIHGGGFTGGSGGDAGMDGGNLVSREDVVLVSINYRLSTLGFLAIPGTEIYGNYGIADQVLALEWVVQNIATFGGDPSRITIVGESAGAASVRTLLGSPPAIGKFHGAIAMSNLGGGVGLGLENDYATTYSNYLTIEQSYKLAGQEIFREAGCNYTNLGQNVNCISNIPAQDLVSYTNVARYVVQDGHYVNSTELNLVRRQYGTANVPVIFGVCPNDGASGIPYPPPLTSEKAGLEYSLGISSEWASRIIESEKFPLYNTGNLTLDAFNVSQRVATDIQFRCIDQATVYAGSRTGVFRRAYFYEIDRTTGGYDPNGLGGPPVTPGYPNGNPNLPYFRVHASDVPWLFGGPITLRDEADLYSLQLVSGYFAEFARSGQPNPSMDYLKARGYRHTIDAIRRTGPWTDVNSKNRPMQVLDYPSKGSEFRELGQCEWLGYPIDYYIRR